MVVPTVLRVGPDWAASVDRSGQPFELADHVETVAPDPAYTAYGQHGDRERFAADATAALRAWSEPR